MYASFASRSFATASPVLPCARNRADGRVSAAVPDEAAATRASVPTNRASERVGAETRETEKTTTHLVRLGLLVHRHLLLRALEGHELRDVTPARHRGGRAAFRARPEVCARGGDRTDARGRV